MQAFFRVSGLAAALATLVAGSGVALAADVIPPAADRPLGLDDGPKIATSGFRVRGVGNHPDLGVTPDSVQTLANRLYAQVSLGSQPSWESAQQMAKPPANAPIAGLTIGQMQLVAEQIAVYLRQQGLVLAQAYVPVQGVGADGVVLVDVLEGKLGKVVVEGDSRLPKDLVAASATPLETRALTKANIETALLTAQTFPGSTVSGTFRPGAKTGETDLVLRVKDDDRFAFSLGGDNYGTKFAGEYRLKGEAVMNNPLGWGDQLSLSAIQAFHPTNTTLGSARYTITPGSPIVHLHAAVERTEFVAENKSFDLFNLDGSNTTQEGGLTLDLARSRTLTVTSEFDYQRRRSEVKFKNNALSGLKLTDDDLRVAVMNINAQHFDAKYQGVDFLNFAIKLGNDKGDAAELFKNDKHYSAADLSYSRYQRVTDNQSILLAVRGQYSDDNLSALERFSLGGPDSVRAYPVSEILKDRGFLSTLEYRIAAPGFADKPGPMGLQWGKILSFVLFADYAWGELAQTPDSDEELSGAGGGLLINIPNHFNFRLSVATPLGSKDPSDGDDVRAYSEVSVLF